MQNSKLDEPLLPLETERQESMHARTLANLLLLFCDSTINFHAVPIGCPSVPIAWRPSVHADPHMPASMHMRVSIAAQLAESARIGTAVLGVLQSQRRSLEGAVNRQTQAAGELEQTSSIMTQMWQRVKRKRLFCMSIAALLFAAIILVLWLKLVVWSHGSTSASGSGGST